MSIENLLPKWSRIIGICLALIFLALTYVNCGEGGSVSSTSSAEPLEIPDPVCGPDGYAFIMKNYFTKYCTSCHTKSGFNPKFADPADMENSFNVSLGIIRSKLIQSITENSFCRNDGCNLDTEDPLYKAIDQWTTMRYSCP
jgi:hypothetical protein